MVSNMGPAYWPQVMNGSLDIWIRGLLLGRVEHSQEGTADS